MTKNDLFVGFNKKGPFDRNVDSLHDMTKTDFFTVISKEGLSLKMLILSELWANSILLQSDFKTKSISSIVYMYWVMSKKGFIKKTISKP